MQTCNYSLGLRSVLNVDLKCLNFMSQLKVSTASWLSKIGSIAQAHRKKMVE